MKKTQNKYPLPSKEKIKEKAVKGFFDRNPLISIPHEVRCKDRGYRNKVMFLDYLRSGKFEVGETKVIEVNFAAPTLTGLGQALERATPIKIWIKCKRCGNMIPHIPVSLEYLFFITKRGKISGIYV